MDMSKGKVINVHIKDGKIICFKACAEVIFCTNINDLTMITNPNNFYFSAYYYLSTVKKFGIFNHY